MTSAEPASRMLAGMCLCGAVHFAVPDAFIYAMNCHCSVCRRQTGAAFKSFAGIEREKLNIIAGADTLMTFGGDTTHDVRCRRCRSYLYSVVREGRFVHVALGTLADAPTIRPSEHIFVGSKAPWFTITDDLPQWEEHARASSRLK